MAFSAITARGSAVSSVTHASLAVSPSAALAVGKIVIVSCVSDNRATADGASTDHLVTDTHSHTWTKVFEETDSNGAALDGSTTSLWWTKITTQIETTNSITNTYQGGSLDAGIITVLEATVDAGNTVATATPNIAHDADDLLSNESISAVLSGLTSREYLFYGLLGAEGNDTAKGAIANYVEQFDLRSGTNAGTDVLIHVGSRILTGTGDTWTSGSVSATNPVQSLTGFYEVAEGTTLSGALFTKAPTFFTGTVSTTYALAGTLFTKAPSFFVGTVSLAGATQNLTGALFQKAPTFFAGTLTSTYALTGTLYQNAPTFFTGAVTATYALTGTLYQNAPVFPQGSVTTAAGPQTVSGVLYQNTPVFFTGTLTATYALTGTLFQNTPTFFAGAVTATVTLDGVLFQKAPTFPQGSVTTAAGPQTVSGVLFTKAPTFFVGAVLAHQTITGTLYQNTPTFFVGSIASVYPLTGALYQNTPVFFAGNIVADQALTGVLYQNTPVFFQGVFAPAGSLFGNLYQNTPVFFTGTMGYVGGSFWRVNPVAYTLNPAAYDPILGGEVPPWAIEVDGEVFVLDPLFFAGSVS